MEFLTKYYRQYLMIKDEHALLKNRFRGGKKSFEKKREKKREIGKFHLQSKKRSPIRRRWKVERRRTM